MNSHRARKKSRRFRDRLKASTPSDFHANPGEDYKERHMRRIEHAWQCRSQMVEFCEVMGFMFNVKNERQHWMVASKGRVAEWWPSTAKLVFDKKFKEGIHAHTVIQVLNEITQAWEL